jgi:hypothetical protein
VSQPSDPTARSGVDPKTVMSRFVVVVRSGIINMQDYGGYML